MPAESIAPVLADAGGAQELLTHVLSWLGALVGALVVLVGVVGYYRRWWRRGEGPGQPPWTLQELRELRARGDLEDDEYRQLRARLLGMTGSTGRADGGAVEGREDSTGQVDGR